MHDSTINKSLHEKLLRNPNDANLWETLFQSKNTTLPNDIDFNTICLINNIKCYPAWNYRRRIRQYYEIEDDEDIIIEILKLDVRNYHAWNYLQYLKNTLIEYVALYFFILDSSNYSARFLLNKDAYHLSINFYKELVRLKKNNKSVIFCNLTSTVFIKVDIENLPRIYQKNNCLEIYFKVLFKEICILKNDELIFKHKEAIRKKFMRINTEFKLLECMKIKINNIYYAIKIIKENIFLINNQP